MLPSNGQDNARSYAYVGGLLNAAYLTGFVRNPHENGFLLQQTNNINHAIPIVVEGKHRKFREKEPVTVVCHAFGMLSEHRDRSMQLKAIKVEVPTLLTMPTEVVWNSRLPAGMKEEDFKPFGAKWQDTIKGQSNNSDVVNEIIEATGGRSDGTLGSSSNSIRIAGFIEGYAMARDSQGNVVDDCLTLLIRQHKDVDRSIPVRLYGRYARTYFSHVSIGRPVRVDGQIRVNYKMQENGEPRTYLYVHTSQLRGADQEVSIRFQPDWVSDMKLRILADHQTRIQAAKDRAPAVASSTASDEDDRL